MPASATEGETTQSMSGTLVSNTKSGSNITNRAPPISIWTAERSVLPRVHLLDLEFLATCGVLRLGREILLCCWKIENLTPLLKVNLGEKHLGFVRRIPLPRDSFFLKSGTYQRDHRLVFLLNQTIHLGLHLPLQTTREVEGGSSRQIGRPVHHCVARAPVWGRAPKLAHSGRGPKQSSLSPTLGFD